MIQQGHKCVVLKIMQQNLKVLKKMLQSKNIKDSTEYKIQQGHKYVVLKIMQQNLKVLKKTLQSKNIKDNIEYRLKVLNQST